MKKTLQILSLVLVTALLVSCVGQTNGRNTDSVVNRNNVGQKILYFNPEVIPDVLEIKGPTYLTFFSAATDKMMAMGTSNYIRIDTPISYENVDLEIVKELCRNNDADLAIVSKVKYFKVGLGKYVFSNQVEVGLKIYDASGNFITETSYDTYKANGRLLGSAENSVKIGTKGALDKLYKALINKNIIITKS